MLSAYLADGTPVGSPVLVNAGAAPALTNGNQDSPAVAMDAAGDIVVVWHSQGSDGVQSSIMGRYFDASTQQWGNPFEVTPYLDNMPQKPAVAMDNSGDFAVVWQSYNQEQVINGSARRPRTRSESSASGSRRAALPQAPPSKSIPSPTRTSFRPRSP